MSLRDDFSMYYRGTYVTRVVDGVRKVLYVEEVSQHGIGRTPADIVLIGHVTFFQGGRVRSVGMEQWAGDSIDSYYPESGYYRVGEANSPVFVEFSMGNRTNRKGLEGSRVLVNGRAVGLSSAAVTRMFCEDWFEGKVFVDMCIHQSRFMWRGMDVGTFHDGQLSLSNDYSFLHDLAGKHIEKFLHRSEVTTNVNRSAAASA